MRCGKPVGGLIACVMLLASSSVWAAKADRLDCQRLSSLRPAHTTLETVAVVPAGSFQPPAANGYMPADYHSLPAFCRVAGVIKPSADSEVRFELWLPMQGWNGRFMQTGNGGAAGSIVYGSLVEPLKKGYAVANTDTGHQGPGGEFTWVPGHPERYTDYAWRAVHELTVAAKAMVKAAYRRPAAKSYWLGCSTGGRQGLKEVQRFPADYDGVVAGAPAANWSPLATLSVVMERELTRPDGLRVEQLPMLKQAAVAACDADDGVRDGVIGEPGKCHFDPAVLACKAGETTNCLSEAAVAGVRAIYAGIRDKNGSPRIAGMGIGSEHQWAVFASPQFRIGTSYYRNVVEKKPEWQADVFDVGEELARADAVDAGATIAMDPAIGPFLRRGGKLLLYHGTSDGFIPHGNTVRYFEDVQRAQGAAATERGVRFYLMPGMDHCYGGDGAYETDWLGAMENWIERGKAPETLIAKHPAPPAGAVPAGTAAPAAGAAAAFARPACPYPAVARYDGSGDANDAANWRCVKP